MKNIMDENRTKAIFLLRKNRTSLVWSGVSTFENNPATLPATQTILEGFSVPGLTLTELEQIKNLGKGVNLLVELLTSEKFVFDQDTACKIHNVVGREEALTWGKFRNDTVSIQNVEYTPPGPDKLPQIWHDVQEKVEKLIAAGKPELASAETFCQMSRAQFFFDCNKRTAWLMSMGILVDAGYPPFALNVRDKLRFNETLTAFYNSGDSTNMVSLLLEYAGLPHPELAHHSKCKLRM